MIGIVLAAGCGDGDSGDSGSGGASQGGSGAARGGSAGNRAGEGGESEGGETGGAGHATGGSGSGRGGSSGGSPASGGSAGSFGGGGACEVPDAQLFDIVHAGATLTFATSDGSAIELGSAGDPDAEAPDAWSDGTSLMLETSGTPYRIKVFARVSQAGCEDALFAHVYEVRDLYTPAAGESGTVAVARDDTSIVGWASGYAAPTYGSDVDENWRSPDNALGAATGEGLDVVGLGNGGSIAMTFDPPIADGTGADFAVFENGFSDTFLELAYVEVSSDGGTFVRFDSAYLGETAVAGFGMHSPTLMTGLAGKHRIGYGTPFDLSLLRYRRDVQNGRVDLGAIRYVRIVDIVGDGTAEDSFGHPIYDPTPTVGSGGFDLEAIAVLNAAGG